MAKTVHLISKLKRVHLCKHEVGQEILVVFRVVSKIGGIPRAHLGEKKKYEF